MLLLLVVGGDVEVIPPRWASAVEHSALPGLCRCSAVVMCCFSKAKLTRRVAVYLGTHCNIGSKRACIASDVEL